MALFFSDKEKQCYRDEVFHYRLPRVELDETAETVTVAVVSEDGGVYQKQCEAGHHQHGEPPDLLEINLHNEAYSNHQLDENQQSGEKGGPGVAEKAEAVDINLEVVYRQ